MLLVRSPEFRSDFNWMAHIFATSDSVAITFSGINLISLFGRLDMS